ncbi:hypothetical protein [Streptomyces sp. NRRL F-2664]|uniref:hypothetical protein n=1 Tax=Streptomyces sp. NRRL F-2664 TaxID=1463842 RepID=UPI0004C8BF6F|nr:hypothetical protein [Streptomyces sp. NRRL F-2664]
MPDDDAESKLIAQRITELEAELRKFSAMVGNLRDKPESNGYQYASKRVDEIVAELEELRAPQDDDERDREGIPFHKVLVGIGLVFSPTASSRGSGGRSLSASAA